MLVVVMERGRTRLRERRTSTDVDSNMLSFAVTAGPLKVWVMWPYVLLGPTCQFRHAGLMVPSVSREYLNIRISEVCIAGRVCQSEPVAARVRCSPKWLAVGHDGSGVTAVACEARGRAVVYLIWYVFLSSLYARECTSADNCADRKIHLLHK